MRAVWSGSITFGLVNIPVSLQNASTVEELKFRLLRASDLSPVNYRRVAQADGKEVAWDQIVKGYEYEKGKFVVLKDEDFRRVDLEATDTIHIVDFVPGEQINPIFFYKPYYVEPGKGGDAAYRLLQRVLVETGRIGIAKVIIRTRQHLAGLKPAGDILALDLMRFSDELVDPASVRTPRASAVGKKEVSMAKSLVEQMTESWDPHRYTDEYRSALMKLIDTKVASGGKELPKKSTARRSTNVIDLAEVLKQSLAVAAAPAKRTKPRKGRTKRRAA